MAAVEWAHLSIALQLATPAAVGAIGFFIRRTLGELDRRMNEQEQRLGYLEKNVVLREHCNRDETVLKEDWLRESGRIQMRQEQTLAEIQQLRGEMASGSQIGAAIAQFLMTRGEKGGEG